MNYIKSATSNIAIITLLLLVFDTCLAAEETKKAPPLILEVDATKPLTFSAPGKNNHTYQNTTKTTYESSGAKKIKRAKKLLNKITTFKYNKNQKIKAHIKKSSYIFQYTYKL